MASLPRRAAAVALATAGLLGLAGIVTEASATTIRHFVATGPNPLIAGQWAWAAAHNAGYTDDQCGAETERGAPGYWKVIVTCVTP